MTASDLVPMLRASAADRVPSRRRGLWVSFLSAYGLEAVLGTRRSAPGTSEAVTAATGADAIDWIGLDLEHGDLDLGDVIPLTRVAEGAGLDAAPEIVAVDGVDGIFVGTHDLSMSLGCRPGDDPVMIAISSVVETVRAGGKIVRMFAGRPDLLAPASVVDLIAVDIDVSVLRRGINELFT